MKIPGRGRITFNVKDPRQKGRASFAITKKLIRERDGKTVYEPLNNPDIENRIDAINQDLKSGALDVAEARVHIHELKKQLEKLEARHLPKQTFSHYNKKLADRFIRDDVQKRKKLRSKKAEENKIWAAINALGNRSLRTINRDDLQDIADRQKSDGTHRHFVRIYNRLLRFIGRGDLKLETRRLERRDPPFLDEQQIRKLVASIPQTDLAKFPQLGNLILICFNLGCRIGEALALEKSCLLQQNGKLVVKIEKQLTAELEFRAPKSRSRLVMPLFEAETFDALNAWIAAGLKPKERHRYRSKVSKTVKSLAQSLFGVNADQVDLPNAATSIADLPSTECEIREFKGVHMLRSSHVRYLLSIGGTLGDAALQLGDHIHTVQLHYSGYTNTKGTLSRIASLINSKQKISA